MKKKLALLTTVIFLLVACGSPTQVSVETLVPTALPPVVEATAAPNHADVLGVWTNIESRSETTNTAPPYFNFKKYEFRDKVLIIGDLIVVDYEWLDATHQVWRDSPAAAGFGGIKINVFVGVAREGNILTLTIGDGYIKLQQ